MKDNAVLFGASKLGKIAFVALKDEYNICFFCDNDSSKWNKEFLGKKVISPKELITLNNYEVIITSSYYNEISEQLLQLGINRFKIFELINKIYLLDGCDFESITKAEYSVKDIEDDLYNERLRLLKAFKNKAKQFVHQSKFTEAKKVIGECESIITDDIEVSMLKATILKLEKRTKEAVRVLKKALQKNADELNLKFELACLLTELGRYNEALSYFQEARSGSKLEIANLAEEKILCLYKNYQNAIKSNRKKIVFFVKPGADTFIDDLIDGLSEDYETKKILVTSYNQIDQGLIWADICWFEWCDDLIAYGSRTAYAKNKIIICRIHGYEVYNELIFKPEWANVDHIIFTATHIKEIFEERIEKVYKNDIQSSLIYCGVDTDLYPLKIKKKGFNLGFLGYINSKKNIPLTLQIFKALYDKDHRYKLFLAGVFTDKRLLEYVEYFIEDNNLQDNIFIEGFKDLDKKIEFYHKIDYILVSSIDEGLCYAAAEAMCCGVKPVLNNCQGLMNHYKKEYIFNGFFDALKMIEEDTYNSHEYRLFIKDNYSLDKQNQTINVLLKEMIEEKCKETEVEKKFCYVFKSGYYLRDSESVKPYMNPWELMLTNSLPQNIIISQIQNQFKYIMEMYFNGNNNLLDYKKFLSYLFKLLNVADIDNQEINGILALYNYDNGNINKVELLENIIVQLYQILSELIRKNQSNDRRKVIINSKFNCRKNAATNDKYIHCLFSKLYENLAPINKYVKSFLIHGSLSTLDYTNYSDVDTYLVLKREIFSDVRTIRYVRKVITNTLPLLYEFDPLQHHGFFIVTEMDLDYYPETYLPLKSMEYGTLLMGEKELHISVRSSRLENEYSLWVMAYSFREMFINKKHPDDLFSLKRYTSRLLLLPSLYLETFFEQYLYKRDSFSVAQKYFSEHAWRAIEIATALRDKWEVNGEMKVNKDFYLASLMLAEECLAKLVSMEVSHEL